MRQSLLLPSLSLCDRQASYSSRGISMSQKRPLCEKKRMGLTIMFKTKQRGNAESLYEVPPSPFLWERFHRIQRMLLLWLRQPSHSPNRRAPPFLCCCDASYLYHKDLYNHLYKPGKGKSKRKNPLSLKRDQHYTLISLSLSLLFVSGLRARRRSKWTDPPTC